jgi:hypothetical protein
LYAVLGLIELHFKTGNRLIPDDTPQKICPLRSEGREGLNTNKEQDQHNYADYEGNSSPSKHPMKARIPGFRIPVGFFNYAIFACAFLKLRFFVHFALIYNEERSTSFTTSSCITYL